MEIINENISFIGRGWAFPPAFSEENLDAVIVSEEEDIRQSLHILLSTHLGERIMQPDFGCNLDELIFSPLNTSLKTEIKDIIKTAILRHEPRIAVDVINLESGEEMAGRVKINLVYTIITTNSRSNLVYPFYLDEGTNVQY